MAKEELLGQTTTSSHVYEAESEQVKLLEVTIKDYNKCAKVWFRLGYALVMLLPRESGKHTADIECAIFQEVALGRGARLRSRTRKENL